MCGLISVLLAPKERDPWELDRIWDIFTEALIQNEERGREATGVGVVQEDGSRRVWKLPLPAHEFVETADYRRHARRAFDNGTICLLGHTRRPTKGKVGNSRNNHPLLTPNIIGIHNGNIDNDDQLFGDYKLPRLGEVDSEAIFALLETIPPHARGGAYHQAVRGRARRLVGKMTTVSLDRRRPGQLLVLKRDMPFSMHYNPDFGAMFYSSRYVFLRKAFGRSVITEALESKQGYIFDRLRFSELETRYSSCFTLKRPQ
jgi:glucosamine 6-phosphate synthetase-like amidotransferase/phosphosugar isomerase protein